MKRPLLGVLGPLAALAVLAGCSEPGPRPAPVASAVASPSALSSPSALPAPITLPQPSDPPLPDIKPFAGADVVIPAWSATADSCVDGRVHMGSGQFIPDRAGKKVINVLSVVAVDFDADGTDDYAAYLSCGEGPEAAGRMIVGYRRTNGTLQPIGRIVGTQDGFQMMDFMRRKGNRIEILVSRNYSDGGMDAGSEWRTFELRNGRFRQVGPAVKRAVIRLSVEAKQVVLRPAGDVRTGTVQFTVRNTSQATAPRLRLSLQLPESFQTAGSSWNGCTSGAPGAIRCPLPDIAGGHAIDVSYDVLGPLKPPAAGPESSISVLTEAVEVYDESVSSEVPLNILYT